MARFAGPENDWLPLAAIDPGPPRLTVAVVIPVYNRVQLLRRTLAGLAAQRGYPPHLMSVVVADDGSEEDIAPAVAEASARQRVYHVRREHDGYGAGQARNLGAAHTGADVVLFVDADCLPDPELVAGHMAWHHRADNLVVVGSRQHVDSTDYPPGQIAGGTIDIRKMVKGEEPPDEAFEPEDWRRRFYRRTSRLRHGNEGFRALLTGNCSLPRDAFLEAGGFSADFRRWGGEDTELGWRLFSSGMFLVPANRAAIYHQEQEETHPEEGWRQEGRAANADLIRSKIPHRFYRRLADAGPFEVPKVSWVVAGPAGRRRGQLLAQMQGQTSSDWEAFFPNDFPRVPEPRLRDLPDEAGTPEQRVLRAIALARGEYVALVSGAAGLSPLLLGRAVRLLDASPRASVATVGYAGMDHLSGDAAWGTAGLPAFALVRRREWSKVLPEGADLADAWRRVRALSWPRHLTEALVTLPPPTGVVRRREWSKVLPEAADLAGAWRRVRALSWSSHLTETLVTLPPPTGVVPASVSPAVPERDRIVAAGRKGTGPRSWLYRLGRNWKRRQAEEDDRPVVAHFGDDRSAAALAALLPWARVAAHPPAAALILGGGAGLDAATWERVRALDAPRLERAVLGAVAGDGPPADWADFLGTCLFVAVAADADAAEVRSWGYSGKIAVVGHPADHPDAAALLLAALREEAS